MAVVEYETQGHIAVITLNRPDARNTIKPAVAARLADAWLEVRTNDEVRVAILTGKRSAFCAGADLGHLPGGRIDRAPACATPFRLR